MKFLLKNAKIYRDRAFESADIVVCDGRIANIVSSHPPIDGYTVLDLNHCFIFPGLVDVHVHLREPGFSYKETMESGTLAAARGGFTAVCAMPNLKPVPDSAEHLAMSLERIAEGACVHVYPYGAITVGEAGETLADLEAMAPNVAAFSDDGKGVQRDEMMREAMLRAKKLGKVIAAHCEDEALLGDSIWGGSPESEWKQVERDLALVAETGCAYHVCHVSTKESVALIRKAKQDGLDVTAETAPHYLLLTEDDRKDEGRFKMNPPIRTAADREALIEGLADGTIDMVATDHAPHSAEEKGKGAKSLNGVTGLETSFASLYTGLVKTGRISLETLLERMHTNPAARFGLAKGLEIGAPADLTVFDLDAVWTINENELVSKAKCTPFHGMTVSGVCRLTMTEGKIVWQNLTEN
ncbi:MAG: dihydroorotase [Clostridia bacterium]|nr:dihydroorotase [Clostridia bacterium]